MIKTVQGETLAVAIGDAMRCDGVIHVVDTVTLPR